VPTRRKNARAQGSRRRARSHDEAYTIDTDDNITAFVSTEELGELKEGTQSFANEEDLARLAAGWPGSRLVEIWNGLPGVQPVQKFTSRKTAVTRIWKAIQGLGPHGAKQAATADPQPKAKKASVTPELLRLCLCIRFSLPWLVPRLGVIVSSA
jgi:hypothetical protein